MQIQRTSGDISVFGQDIQEIRHFQGINITAQDDILWPFLTIEEHFCVLAHLSRKPKYEKRFEYLTNHLQLDTKTKLSSILSGGNKRKLCSAMTLLTKPKLAFFDEPTTGIDPFTRRNLLRQIKMLKSSVLFTTHRLDEAEYLCSRIAILKHGKVLFQGLINDIKYEITQTSLGHNMKQQGLVIFTGKDI